MATKNITEKENLRRLMSTEVFKTVNPQIALAIAMRYAELDK